MIEVEWRPQRTGIIVPRVIHEQITMHDGHKHQYVAGNNAQWIREMGIGPGAVVLIRKRVTPKIQETIKRVTPVFPDIPYHWGDPENPDIVEYPREIYANEFTAEMCMDLITHFFAKNGMDIKSIGPATIEKLYLGGLDTLLKIIGASSHQMQQAGIGEKTADKAVTEIHSVMGSATLPSALGSSSIMGRGIGKRKLAALFDAYPNMLADVGRLTNQDLIQRVAAVDGFSTKTAELIVVRLPYAKQFIDALQQFPFVRFKTTEEPTGSAFTGQIFVFSGVRPDSVQIRPGETLETIMLSQGAKFGSGVSKKTTLLIVKEEGEETKKVRDAHKNNVPIVTLAEFINSRINGL